MKSNCVYHDTQNIRDIHYDRYDTYNIYMECLYNETHYTMVTRWYV